MGRGLYIKYIEAKYGVGDIENKTMVQKYVQIQATWSV
jgi:hypothetical protein